MGAESDRAARTAPSLAGLRRLAAAIGGGGRLTPGERLGGGVAAVTHRLALHEPDGTERALVLKRYPVGNLAPELEWERLGCAARASVPTPERVAVDPAGHWFGEPALVMTALPGRVEMAPGDVDDWTRQLALALAEIHRTELGSHVSPVVRRPHRVSRWRPWDGVADERMRAVAAVIERLQRSLPVEPEVFCHDDFHPGNVLFQNGRVSGVVDWSSARLAPAVADVANLRAELAIAPAGDAPDRFLRHYAALSSAPLERLASWDVLAATHALEFGAGWVEAYAAVGVTLGADQILGRTRRFVDDALSRC